MWFGTTLKIVGNNNNCGLELETLTFAEEKKMDGSRSDEEFNEGMDCGKVVEGGDVDQEIEASGGGEEGEGSGCDVESESDSDEGAPVSLEQRLDAIDAKLNDLRMGMSLFGERLGELIALSNNQAEGNCGKRDVVTSLMFETYVDEAISNGHSFGVSRCFIQEFITKTFSLPCNKYLQRRIGATLRKKISEGAYKVENNLYSFYKEQSKKIDS